MDTCKATTRNGKQCMKTASKDSEYCYIHKKQHDNRIKKQQTADYYNNQLKEGSGASVTKQLKQHDKSNKISHSVYLITINTNKPINKIDSKYKKEFENVMDNLYKNNLIIEFFRYSNKPPSSEIPYDDIVKYSIQTNNEIGKLVNMLHNHSVIHISHTKRIQVSIPLLRSFLKRILGSVYLNVRAFDDNQQYAIDYVNK